MLCLQVLNYLSYCPVWCCFLHFLMMAFTLIRCSRTFHDFRKLHEDFTSAAQIFRPKATCVVYHELDVDKVFLWRPAYQLGWIMPLHWVFLIFYFLSFLFQFNNWSKDDIFVFWLFDFTLNCFNFSLNFDRVAEYKRVHHRILDYFCEVYLIIIT